VATDFSRGNGNVRPDDFNHEWGPVLEIWEGYATEPEIRFQGSSGGALTAISAYCLEQAGMYGVLHIGPDEHDPIRNRTRLSRTRQELLAASGSRYSPASVCNHLEWVEQAPGPCVIIGKPSEVAGLRNAERLRPALASKVGVALSFFCAETPSTRGTLSLLQKMGVDRGSLTELRYRGRGWPGYFAPMDHRKADSPKMTYRESWGFLQAFRPWAVHMWPDGTGELADISCGDPWYEQPDGRNAGFSLIVVRTVKGREILRGARAAGYLELQPAERWKLEKSQSGLVLKKGTVWGRRLALRLMGLPVTRFNGLQLFHCWRKLPLREKLRSIVGTLRRVVVRQLYRPVNHARSEHLPVT
jgi:coenzyme F420 hydrogenase subunit beta